MEKNLDQIRLCQVTHNNREEEMENFDQVRSGSGDFLKEGGRDGEELGPGWDRFRSGHLQHEENLDQLRLSQVTYNKREEIEELGPGQVSLPATSGRKI